MIWSIYPLKDSTLYERFPSQNTGRDEILEISKYVLYSTSSYSSRILIKFDLTDLSSSLSDNTINSSPEYYLNLKLCEAYQLPFRYTIEAFPISGSWEMGIGKFYDSPLTSEGVSWKYRDGSTQMTSWITGSYATNTTGSYYQTAGGGVWYLTPSSSQSFENESAELNLNITSIVNTWLSGSIANEGLILKWSDDNEESLNNIQSLKFYSVNSHTVYLPKLNVKWNSITYVTQSHSYSTQTLTSATESYDSIIYPNITLPVSSSLFTYNTSSITYTITSESKLDIINYAEAINSGKIQITSGKGNLSGSFDGYISGSFNSSSSFGSGSGICIGISGVKTYPSSSIVIATNLTGSYIGYFSGSAITEFSGSMSGSWAGTLSFSDITGSISYNYFNTQIPSYNTHYYTTSSITLYCTSSNNLNALTNSEDIVVYPVGLKQFYQQNSKITLPVKSRPKFPDKNIYVTESLYKTSYILPETSYYSIKDAHSEEIVVEFDTTYTKLGCGGLYDSNYFTFWCNGFQPERNYRLLIKTVRGSQEQIFDEKWYFKVVR